MKFNIKNPFLWVVVVLVGLGLLGRSQGYGIDSPAASIGYVVLGLALGIAYSGYNRGGWHTVLPEFERLLDILTGRW